MQLRQMREAKKLADERHIEYEERHKKGDIINLFFEEYCEKELIQPTFIMDHPLVDLSADQEETVRSEQR